MVSKKGSVRKIGRDAKTGQFIPVKEAERRKSTTVVETIKKKGKLYQTTIISLPNVSEHVKGV